jgi:glycosyltransferase involved in cell wall biosynthesis
MAVKIMYLVDQYLGPWAGTEGQLLHLLQHLDRSRFEPTMVLLRDSDYVRQNSLPCPVRVVGITKLASAKSLARMLRLAFVARCEGVRLVHCFFNDSALIAPAFLKMFGIRVLASRRDMGIWYTRGNLPILRMIARFVDRYVANSAVVKRLVQEQEGVPARKISVIYNGYPREDQGHASALAAPALADIEESAPIVGIVANLRPIKRIDTLVEAFARVSARFPSARLAVVGDNASEQARGTMQQLEALARRLAIRDRIVFAGQVTRPADYIARFTVAVLSSESEGFSNSIIEYMRASRPVVCTDAGGNPEIVEDGVTGFLFRVGDADALAERLDLLLSDSPLARRLGEEGYRKVRSLTLERMVGEQMTCYDDVLSDRR